MQIVERIGARGDFQNEIAYQIMTHKVQSIIFSKHFIEMQY